MFPPLLPAKMKVKIVRDKQKDLQTDRQIDRYLYIWFIGEGVVVSNSSQEHLNADDEILYV